MILVAYTLVAIAGLVKADKAKPSTEAGEWWLLRSNLSVHTGWLLAASVVTVGNSATALQASPASLLALAFVSLLVVQAVAYFFTINYFKPDAAISLVVTWALVGVHQELRNPAALLNPNRPYFYAWPQVVIDGFGIVTLLLAALSLVLAIAALFLRFQGPQSQPYLPLVSK